jgi:hypothetical protein
MAAIYGSAQVTAPTIASAGGQRQIRVNLDGSVVTQDWIQAAIAEGQVFAAQSGSGTAPTTVNATYAAAEQDLYVYVPAGTVIIPLFIGINFEDTGTALVLDVLAGYSLNGDSAVTGTALTAYNYKTGASPNTGCTVTGVVTSGGTTHLGGDDFLEFWRPTAGFAEDAFNGSTAWVNNRIHGMTWSAKAMPAPIIGSSGAAGALSIYAGAQAGTAFITAVWAEFPATRFA